MDTRTTADRFDSALGALTIHNKKKVARAEDVVEQNVDFEALYTALGLKK